MADKGFMSVIGIVQFDVKEREAQGKTVRDVTVRSVGTQSTIKATVWPNFKHVPLKKGDILAIEGKGSQNTVDGEDGPKTYNNLSVNAISVLGTVEYAPKPDVQNAAPAQTDDIPF